MAKEHARNSDGVDADKLVHRLLDIIQRQQSDFAAVRQQIEVTLRGNPEGKIASNVRDLLPSSLSEDSSPTTGSPTPGQLSIENERTPGLRVIRSQSPFIILCLLLAIGTVILSVRSPKSELQRLNAESDRLHKKLDQMAIDRDREIRQRDDAILGLQQELLRTQKALRDNEDALADATGIVSSPHVAIAPQVLTPEPLNVGQLESAARNLIERLRQEIEQVSSSIKQNKEVLLGDLESLKNARLALYKADQEWSRRQGTQANTETSSSKGSADGIRIKEVANIIKSIEMLSMDTLGGERYNDLTKLALSDLRECQSLYMRQLSNRQKALKAIENEILEIQNDIVSVQSAIREKQDQLVRVSVVSSGDTRGGGEK